MDHPLLILSQFTKAGFYNLQIQVNYGTTISTLKNYAPRTIAGPVLVSPEQRLTPSEIRAAFFANMVF